MDDLGKDDLEMVRPKPDLLDRPAVRWTLFGIIPALVFVLVSAGIRVSQYGIDHTVLVFGDPVLVSDRPAAIRVSLMADDGRFFLPERLTGRLVRGEKRHLLFDGAVSDRGMVLGRELRVPPLPPGRYTLELDIRFDKRRRTVRANVQVVDRPPEEHLEVPDDTKLGCPAPRVLKGEAEVQVFTEDRGAPTGISSDVFLRTLDRNGEPVSVPLSLTVGGDGKPLSRRTDRFGLLRLEVRPAALDIPLTVSGARKVEEADGAVGEDVVNDQNKEKNSNDAGPPPDRPLLPNVVYSGIAATVDKPLTPLGEPIVVSMEQVSSGGPVFADLFHEGRFVKASSGWLTGQEAAMRVKLDFPGLFRMQLSTSAMGAGKGVAVRHFYVLKKGEDPDEGLKTLLKRLENSEKDGAWAKAVLKMPLETLSGPELQELAAFVLSRLYQGHREPDRLISSRKEDDAELNAFKERFQRSVMLAIIALGLAVSLLIGLFALTAHRKQQRISKMILEDSEELDGDPKDWAVTDGLGHSKSRLLVQGAILFFIVLGAFIAIALLVDTITWGS